MGKNLSKLFMYLRNITAGMFVLTVITFIFYSEGMDGVRVIMILASLAAATVCLFFIEVALLHGTIRPWRDPDEEKNKI